MTQHTPGPWALMSGMPTNVLGNGGIRVARCDFDGDFSHPECAANARLIAAAPELLENLQLAQIWLDCDGRFDMRGINAAIAKAEGR